MIIPIFFYHICYNDGLYLFVKFRQINCSDLNLPYGLTENDFLDKISKAV